jgi:hypothetical protein
VGYRIVNTKKKTKTQQGAVTTVVVPRLVKATEVAAREAARTEAEQQAREQRVVKPVVRTPRNAMEARDLFNSLFNEAA